MAMPGRDDGATPTASALAAERAVADALRASRSVVVLSGAGVSAESGLATFRDGRDALWNRYPPERLATPEAFDADPALVSEWYDLRRLACLAASPNAAHLALAALERHLEARGGSVTLLTQNVDGLHRRAGSRRVVELHGTIITWRCTRSGERVTPGPEAFPSYPVRSAGGGLYRPDVVWFGEALPEAALEAAAAAVRACDVLVVVGTSARVWPAAGLIHAAAAAGAFVAEVNVAPSEVSHAVDAHLRGAAGEVLPRLVAEMACAP